jgi:formate hydrogenlyase subunit 3/multisubunit Na+/H+ antiporter MnhD subunit
MITIHSLASIIIESAPFLCLLTPLPLLFALFLPTDRREGFALRTVVFLSGASLLLAILTCITGILSYKPIEMEWLSWGPVGLTIYFDTLSGIMLLLVSFLWY